MTITQDTETTTTWHVCNDAITAESFVSQGDADEVKSYLGVDLLSTIDGIGIVTSIHDMGGCAIAIVKTCDHFDIDHCTLVTIYPDRVTGAVVTERWSVNAIHISAADA